MSSLENGLSQSVLNQLKSIGLITISPTNWNNLGLLNQAVSTNSSVRFSKVGINQAAEYDALQITGNNRTTLTGKDNSISLTSDQAAILNLNSNTSTGRYWQLRSDPSGNFSLIDAASTSHPITIDSSGFMSLSCTFLGVNTLAGEDMLRVGGSVGATALNAYIYASQAKSVLGTFLNNGMTAGQITSIAVGQTQNTYKCACFGYQMSDTLADSHGRLGMYGNDDIINWSFNGSGRVGIDQLPGTEALEVTGNVKITGSITSGGGTETFTPTNFNGLTFSSATGTRAKTCNMVSIQFEAHWNTTPSAQWGDPFKISCGSIANFVNMHGHAVLYTANGGAVPVTPIYEVGTGGIYFQMFDGPQSVIVGHHINDGGSSGYIKGYAYAFV